MRQQVLERISAHCYSLARRPIIIFAQVTNSPKLRPQRLHSLRRQISRHNRHSPLLHTALLTTSAHSLKRLILRHIAILSSRRSSAHTLRPRFSLNLDNL